jgi:hypothetical protein
MLKSRLTLLSPTRWLLAAAVALCAGASQAAPIDITGTWDLVSQSGSINPGAVTIHDGDDVTFKVTFLGNQTLNFGFGNESFITGLTSGDNYSNFTISAVSMNLFGFNGGTGTSSLLTKATDSSGTAHLGPTWDHFLTVGQSVSFSGFEVGFHVDSIQNTMHSYDMPLISYFGDNVSIGVVPEPSELALFSVGLLGLGLTRRRRSAGK